MSRDTPRWAPHYGAQLPDAFARFWTGYLRFDGRASRSEFWWWAAVDATFTVALGGMLVHWSAVAGSSASLVSLGLWWAATFLPRITLTARRMHDVDLSGWVLFVVLIPTLGALAILVLAALPSNPRGARFDRPPPGSAHIPVAPGAERPQRDYGWPPLPLPYAGPAGGQPLFDDPPERDEPTRP